MNNPRQKKAPEKSYFSFDQWKIDYFPSSPVEELKEKIATEPTAFGHYLAEKAIRELRKA